MNPGDSINTIRLSNDALRSLAQVLNQRDKLDELERKGRGHRGQARHEINPPREVTLEMQSDAVGKKSYAVFARDLSAHGISLLHGVFVAPNTRCIVTLNNLDGEIDYLAGVVRRCRLVGGRVHELGVKFDKPIEPGKYLVLGSEDDAASVPQNIDLDALLSIAKGVVAACEEKKPASEIAAMLDQARQIVAKAA